MKSRSRSVGLGVPAAREVLLVQAFESVEPASPHWTVDDAAWATRAAREAAVPAATTDGSLPAFVAARASLALKRLLPRELAVGAVLRAATGPGRRAGAAAVALGFAVGLFADAIGSSQRMNLLAPPVWTVVVWNLVVYLLLLGALTRSGFGKPPARPRRLARFVERLVQRGASRREADALGAARASPAGDATASALRLFGQRISAAVAPVAASHAVALLHAAAAALGLGLVAGLYARGLVFDYRVAWESTFLSPAEVHAVLSTLLAPASRLAGIALPDVAAVAALRASHGDPAIGAPAAPWIHLYALTLVLAVVVPRATLAIVAAVRARHLAAHVPLPFADAYFRRLELERRGGVVRVALNAYAQPPSDPALTSVRALLTEVLGAGVHVDVAATTPFGGEDDAAGEPATAAALAATLVVALFDLGATPEPEHQGRFVDALAARASAVDAVAVVVVDETAFARRFGSDGRRIAERRDAWSRLLAAHGTVPVFAGLEAADPAASVAALRRALASPARPRR